MSQSSHEYFPDWMLMAYADGELDPPERAAIGAYIAADPDAWLRLASFKRSGRALASLFEQPMCEPVPAYLIETVRQAGRPQTSAEFGLWARLTRLLTPGAWVLRFGVQPLAFAAPAAVIAVVLALVTGERSEAVREPGIAAHVRLALETLPSRADRAGEPGRESVTPVLTFKSASGRFCRQYVATSPEGGRVAGVGCRIGEGQWRIEAQVPLIGTAARPGESYSPAGGPASAALDAAIDRLITGDPLSAADEAAFIAARWHIGR